MSVLSKGTFTVAGATTLASVLIFITGMNSVNAEMGSASKLEPTAVTRLPSEQKTQGMSHSTTFPMSPPPIGPFQVSKPNQFGSMVLRNSVKPNAPRTMMGKSDQTLPIKAPMAPMINKMNHPAPQPPKVGVSKPKGPTGKMAAPTNKLIKPQAPVQKKPEVLSAPPKAPEIQRYMYVPVPINLQAPPLPVGSTYTMPSIPAVGVGKNKQNSFNKNIQQPVLQPSK